ncbi:MAG: CpsD/CapB family tyrosine-protein kinase, partial [Candidatus Omnitrophica bacterium]|nr:CpsD/CapB family tyrosine-protein kinase [Candidatus Omnitrophota bacterium]MCA9439826.1 CpsD/CapB family tyrosine-protein kinase [Candidatus Omnitrophota bacterium]
MSRIEEALKKAQQGNQDGGPALEAPKRSKRRRRTKDEIAKLSYLATVRTNLQFSLTDVERPCVMFCSATRKEGVSTILYYISQLMAAEYRTLVVDSNLLNPSLHEMYEVSNDKGLSDIYLRKASLEDCIQSTRFNGLDILTTGQDPRECFRYMGSATAGKMLKDCRSRYECILIDAPPVRDCPDTAALGAHCDG